MDGTIFADKVIISEAPGDREVAQKLPLVGGSGSVLWRCLVKQTGLSRKDFYITNVSKRQVSFTDTRKAINKNELSLWCELLIWELGHLPNVRYILGMGNFVLQALAGHQGITSWRGSVLDINIRNHATGELRPVKFICINNAAAIVRSPQLEPVFKMDIGTFKRVLDGKHKPTNVTTILYPDIAEIDRFLKAASHSTDAVGHDIETIAGETACIGFADTSSTAICIAFRTKTDQVYSTAEEMYIRRQIQSYYQTNPRLIAQNGAFDATWQWYKDCLRLPPLYFDTMLAHHTLYPQLPHNLGFQVTQYTDNPYYKDEIKAWREGEDIDTFWKYNGQDCAHLIAIMKREIGELKDQGLDKFFFEHVMRLQPHLIESTVGGILVDTEVKANMYDTLAKHVGELTTKFQKLCQDATGNPNALYNTQSPKQMSELYFSQLKLVGRGVSTDAENRDRMFKHPRTNEAARQILSVHNELATEQKFFGTYVKTAIDPDNRIRCSWNQTGVQSAPGRLSSSQTLWDSGTNFQNQPDRALEMFIADPGYGFSYYDLAQVEARCVAYEANIPIWKEQFERARIDGSYDAHRALASDMYHIPYNEVPTFDRYDATKGHVIPPNKKHGDVTIRYIAKRCRHGLNYRMGPDRLATTAGISLAEADSAYRVYHRNTPELRVWWAALEQELKNNGALFNPFGRRYMLMERPSPEALESIVAFKPQSTNGDKNCRVIYQSHDHPKWPRRTRIRINVHDALIALGPLNEREQALAIMKRYAEEPIIIKGEQLIVPADTKLSYPDGKGIHRWSQMTPFSIEKESS